MISDNLRSGGPGSNGNELEAIVVDSDDSVPVAPPAGLCALVASLKNLHWINASLVAYGLVWTLSLLFRKFV